MRQSMTFLLPEHQFSCGFVKSMKCKSCYWLCEKMVDFPAYTLLEKLSHDRKEDSIVIWLDEDLVNIISPTQRWGLAHKGVQDMISGLTIAKLSLLIWYYSGRIDLLL